MLKSVTAINHLGESLKLELNYPEKSGIVIESIDGLGPPNATVNITNLAGVDGGIDNSSRLESRNIVLELIFLEKPTIEDTRLLTYKYFPIKRKITLVVETDERKVQISGVVESNEPDIFSDQEGTQISIMCSDPYFYSYYDERTDFYGVTPLFHFPFSNKSLTKNTICFGEINIQTFGDIFYNGDIENGMTIMIDATGPVGNIEIYNTGTREQMIIIGEKIKAVTGTGINAGDQLILNTVRGKRSLILQRAGRIINVINAIRRPTNWFELSKGPNHFAYLADGLEFLTFRISFGNLYEGV